jgi:glutathione S-transferase
MNDAAKTAGRVGLGVRGGGLRPAAGPAPAGSDSPSVSTGGITLYGFGPFLGTPDSSPFVIKVMLLLELGGLPYRVLRGNPFTAPRRLLPFIDDDGVRVADSTFIRLHLERKYGVDFDAGLSAEQKAVAWSVERMCEDHLYFAMLEARWLDRANFANGLGRHMFGGVPMPLRPLVKVMLRRMNAKRLHGHGIGRHGPGEIAALALRDIDALAVLLGDRPHLMGDRPCGADATLFALVTAILTPPLDTPLRTAMAAHANLVAYRDRIGNRYFPAAPAFTDSSQSRNTAVTRVS